VNYSEAEPLFPEFLTQKDLVTFTALAKQAEKEQVQNITSRLGTTEYLDQPVNTYSSGMLKKTGLVLAFLGRPKLIVLDEPFITIDTKSTDALVTLIKDYHQSGTSFLISSHVTDGQDQLPIAQTYQIGNKTLAVE